ncbi:TPA: DUF262 domain-containing protein [Clostridium botulinum]|nr:DUF262 domain-containing protein [Clostridium botulinum]
MGIQNFAFRPIGSYLQDGIYFIPDYQREYSWVEDIEIDDFWQDLENSIKENREQHFFGQIVIHNSIEENKKYVIDGQQRTSTSVIFLAVLRNIYEEIYNNYKLASARNKLEDIRLKYIGRWSEEENELRLHLGKIDREYYMKNIQIGYPLLEEECEKESHRRIKKAYYYFKNKMKEKIESFSDYRAKYEEVTKYYNKFIECFKIMYVETDDINEAFIIFETLNARGKDLETSDLLKNHLFRISGNSLGIVKEKWQQTIDNLDKIDTTKFIRHYWNSISEFTREKDLYKRIREYIFTPKKSEEFIQNLYEMSEVYKCMVNPDEEIYFLDNDLNKILSNLKTLKASSFYPIILSMVNMNFSEQDIRFVAQKIEVLIFRNCVLAGKVANKYEVLFAKIAHGIYEKELINTEDIYKKILRNTISDEEFRNSFRVFIIKSVPVAKYVLREINNSINNEVYVIEDNQKIHLEHIMPKKKGEWDITTEICEKYLNRVGNLTLLFNEYNRSISNKLFGEKKSMYKKSKISISNDICKYDNWSVENINKRQEELCEFAIHRWSI